MASPSSGNADCADQEQVKVAQSVVMFAATSSASTHCTCTGSRLVDLQDSNEQLHTTHSCIPLPLRVDKEQLGRRNRLALSKSDIKHEPSFGELPA